MAFLSNAEIDRYLRDNALEYEFGPEHSRPAVRAAIAETRRVGYALNPGLEITGSWGMGAAVFDAKQERRWALSLTGVEHRFAAARQPELGALLPRSARELTLALIVHKPCRTGSTGR